MPTALIALAFLIAGGVGLGAEQATPGDSLYPIKVEVNEKVRGAFKFNTENNAEWRAFLAERRLSEVEQLALRDKLSAEVTASLETRLEAHIDAYEEAIAKLQAAENYEAIANLTARLESSLRAHRAIIAKLGAETEGETQTQIEQLLVKIDNQLEIVVALRVAAEAEVDIKLADKTDSAASASIVARLAAAETQIDNLVRFITSKSDRLSAETQAEAMGRLEVARADIVAARALVEARTYAEAQILVREINDIINETRTMVTANGILGLGAQIKIINNKDDIEGDEKKNTDSRARGNENINSNADIRANGLENIRANIGL